MKRQRSMLAVTAVGALLFLLTVGAPIASADTITYSLSNSNLGSSFTGPFGSVLVDLTSPTTATITFTAASGYVFIDSQIADVNVNATSFTVASFSGYNGTVSTGSGNVNGFGSFNLTTSQPAGFGNAVSSVSFVITNTSGTWASAANVLAANNNGGHVAAHIAPTSLAGACTGFASDGTESSGGGGGSGGCSPTVPDGGMTLTLLGGALLGLETLRRKFRA